jgi:tetratricopeptide (TPR) repeat protein
MGSKLALLAVQLIAATLLARSAAADTKARELYKRGIDQYKAQKYAEAVATLRESYDLDPKPDALFALAQAERLAGKCPDAIAHYKKLLASTTELPTAKAVQSNLDLCGPEPEKEPPPAPPPAAEPPPPPPPPKTITRTVTREVRRSDKLATLMFASGMLGLGAGGGLYLASTSSRDDAARALTLDDHDRITKRADTQRLGAAVAGGAGVLMIGVAVVRWATGGGGAKTTEVTFAPSAHGTLLVVSSGW